jgi:hypothetical protein
MEQSPETTDKKTVAKTTILPLVSGVKGAVPSTASL